MVLDGTVAVAAAVRLIVVVAMVVFSSRAATANHGMGSPNTITATDVGLQWPIMHYSQKECKYVSSART